MKENDCACGACERVSRRLELLLSNLDYSVRLARSLSAPADDPSDVPLVDYWLGVLNAELLFTEEIRDIFRSEGGVTFP